MPSCCARAASGQVAATPPRSEMKSRRLMSGSLAGMFVVPAILLCRKSARRRHSSYSLDHLVAAQQDGCRQFDAEHLGGFEVDDRLERGRSLKRQVTWLGALENLVDEGCCAPEQSDEVDSKSHETARGGEIWKPNRWQASLQCKLANLRSAGNEDCIVE